MIWKQLMVTRCRLQYINKYQNETYYISLGYTSSSCSNKHVVDPHWKTCLYQAIVNSVTRSFSKEQRDKAQNPTWLLDNLNSVLILTAHKLWINYFSYHLTHWKLYDNKLWVIGETQTSKQNTRARAPSALGVLAVSRDGCISPSLWFFAEIRLLAVCNYNEKETNFDLIDQNWSI